MMSESTLDRLALEVLKANVLELREVPAKITNAEVETLWPSKRPFLYASGNWGPGYLMIKGLVGRRALLKRLIRYLAFEVAERWSMGIDFVAGNVTGGVVPGWGVAEELEILLGRPIPFVYIRETRKTGGQKELITGIENNPEIAPGARGLNMEELVNFAQTIKNGANNMRGAGYRCNTGACLLYYNNPQANKDLKEAGIEVAFLLTLQRIINVALRHQTHPKELLDDYQKFLDNPLQWQADRGLIRAERGGTQ